LLPGKDSNLRFSAPEADVLPLDDPAIMTVDILTNFAPDCIPA
jgi:hypothetical protein